MERVDRLHNVLLEFYPNVYFQPPATLKMSYPCIVYSKTSNDIRHADNDIYKERQLYNVTVIEHDPDSDVSVRVRDSFRYASIQTYFTKDNLHQTVLNIYI